MLVVRRFTLKTNGIAHVVKPARLLDLPMLPPHGYVLMFEDGSEEASVAGTHLRAWPSPRPPGVLRRRLEIRTGAEPAERVEGAVLAGGTKLEDAAP